MTKFRCSNCGTIVEDHQVKCHACGAVFGSGASNPSLAGLGNILGALTGNRSMDEIKEDWVFEIRRGIVGGMQKTFGVDGEGNDTFKEEKPKQLKSKPEVIDIEYEVVDADFEVISEEPVEEKTSRFKPAQKMENLPKNIQDALRKRMGVVDDDSNDNSE